MKKDFTPHMMYDPKTGKGYMAKKYDDHVRMDKMGYTHEKPDMKDEQSAYFRRDKKLPNLKIKVSPKQGKVYNPKTKKFEEVDEDTTTASIPNPATTAMGPSFTTTSVTDKRRKKNPVLLKRFREYQLQFANGKKDA